MYVFHHLVMEDRCSLSIKGESGVGMKENGLQIFHLY